MNESYYDYFNEIYPHVFIDETINYDYITLKQDNLDDLLEINKFNSGLELPIPLYSYEELESLRNIDKENSIITLTSLIPDNDNILYKDAIEQLFQNIKSEKISYIDISSSIKIVKNKRELIFSFEKVIYKLQYLSNMKFLIQETLKEDTIKLFPIYFHEVFKLEEEQKKMEEIKPGHFEHQHILSITKEVNDKLLGHQQFKKDFQFNLTKFSILNKLNERRILSIFICGKSGIGKTEFAKILSKAMYPNESLIKIDFGNYSTEGVLNSLIGSPLGYVGSEEGGELINKIKTSRSKVILIDEFEKATPSVYNFFYELLEDGKFTDRRGVEHDLDGYIIVFTSNINKNQYANFIPDSLKSRFDMVYEFDEIKLMEKRDFINQTARRLISLLKEEYDFDLHIEDIYEELIKLSDGVNIRNIKREVENVVLKHYLNFK